MITNDPNQMKIRLIENLTKELVKRSDAGIYSFDGILPNPDPTLRRTGQQVTIYDTLMRDPDVSSAFGNAVSAVTKQELSFDQTKASPAQVEFLQRAWQEIDLRGFIESISRAHPYGSQVMEIVYDWKGVMLLPDKIVARPFRRFGWNASGELLYTDANGQPRKTVDLPYKFIAARVGVTDENPYGAGFLSELFWHITYKQGAFDFWGTFLEKYGIPWLAIIAHYLNLKSNDDEYNKQYMENLRDSAEGMIQDAVIVLKGVTNPDGTGGSDQLEFKEPSKADGAGFQMMLDYCNKGITKRVLGHASGTEETPGKLGDQTFIGSVRADIVDSYTTLAQTGINELCRNILSLNFGSSEGFDNAAVLSFPKKIEIGVMATEDSTLNDALNKSGLALSKQHFIDRYPHLKPEYIVDKPTAPTSGFGFAEGDNTDGGNDTPPDQKAVDKLLEQVAARQMAFQSEAIIEPVMKFLNQKSSYKEAIDSIHTVYPHFNSKDFESVIAQMMWMAEITGFEGSRIETGKQGATS